MPTPTIGGSRFYIGGKRLYMPDKLTLVDFAPTTWLEIDGATTFGSVGVTQNTGSHTTIKSSFERFFKTTKTGSLMDNQFVPMALDPGQIAFQAAQEDCNNYDFKVEWGAGCTPTNAVTISVATPGVVTWNDHGFFAGQPIVFSSTGTHTASAPPAGMTLMFAGLAMTNTWAGGEATASNLLSFPIQINSNIVRV